MMFLLLTPCFAVGLADAAAGESPAPPPVSSRHEGHGDGGSSFVSRRTRAATPSQKMKKAIGHAR